MSADYYFGTYVRFDTASKKDASVLLGADNLVGDTFSIEFITTDGMSVAWMKNRFNSLVGYFDADTSRQLNILAARGWKLQALLSFVAYTDIPEPGHYWGEVALICYDKSLETPFDTFVQGLSARIADGIRPEVELGEQGVQQVTASDGSWQPKRTIPFPEKTTGTVILKKRRKLSEKFIEQGRGGNKGCYIFSWAFLLFLVAAVIFGLKSCGVF